MQEKSWLINQYSGLKKSPHQIARKLGCSQSAVRCWLKKSGTHIRNSSEAARVYKSLHVTLTGEVLEFLCGDLLGDGHIEHGNRHSAAFTQGSKHRKHLLWLSKELKKYGIGQIGKIYKNKTQLPGYNKEYTYYVYCSRHYAELKNLWKKWYRPATKEEREKGITFPKVVPKDLKLTPLMCRQWYIDDGHLATNKRSNYIYICAKDFSSVEIDFLAGLLSNLRFLTRACKDKYIWISTKSTPDFLNYIGPCPVKCFEYKWRRR